MQKRAVGETQKKERKGKSMKTIKETHNIDTNLIKFNKTYQRFIEKSRVKKIISSMMKYDKTFWPSSIITLNELYEVIDGQHRVTAAKILMIKEVPACIVEFENKEAEARYFADINNHNTSLKPVDFWHSRMMGGCPLAQFVYLLESSDLSKLKNKICIKGQATKDTKLSISTVVDIVAIIALGYSKQWRKDSDDIILQKFNLINKWQLMTIINEYIEWLELCFGKKTPGSIPYMTHIHRAIMRVYKLLNEKDVAHTKATIVKFNNLYLSREYLKLPESGALQIFIDHYNKGKHEKNKI
jgi:hypothetical protein